jgi:hypothetical protein
LTNELGLSSSPYLIMMAIPGATLKLGLGRGINPVNRLPLDLEKRLEMPIQNHSEPRLTTET